MVELASMALTEVLAARQRRRAVSTTEPAVFVSYATADAGLVLAFTNFLQLGCNLNDEQIFVTARPGALRPGEQFGEAIRDALEGATIAVLLLTPSYYESRFCLAEAGAIWGAGKRRVPICVPPIDFADLEGVQLGEQALKLDSPSDLDTMRDEIVKALGARPVPTGTWNRHKDDFLNRWTTEFEGRIAEAKNVPVSERDHWKSEAEARDRENADLRDDVERLRRLSLEFRTQNDQLRERVSRAPPQPGVDGDERAQRLAAARAAIEVARRHMQLLPDIAQEALYQQFHDKRPLTVGGQLDRFRYADAYANEQRGWVEWFEGEEQAVTPRKAKPEVEAADAALRSVREQVFNGSSLDARSEAGAWIRPYLRETYGITDPTFEIKDTWEKLGFL